MIIDLIVLSTWSTFQPYWDTFFLFYKCCICMAIVLTLFTRRFHALSLFTATRQRYKLQAHFSNFENYPSIHQSNQYRKNRGLRLTTKTSGTKGSKIIPAPFFRLTFSAINWFDARSRWYREYRHKIIINLHAQRCFIFCPFSHSRPFGRAHLPGPVIDRSSRARKINNSIQRDALAMHHHITQWREKCFFPPTFLALRAKPIMVRRWICPDTGDDDRTTTCAVVNELHDRRRKTFVGFPPPRVYNARWDLPYHKRLWFDSNPDGTRWCPADPRTCRSAGGAEDPVEEEEEREKHLFSTRLRFGSPMGDCGRARAPRHEPERLM